ncbi:glycosyltransferase family 2 protein [Haloarcula salina]|uniref:Glycosyltransferase family 2 protein n=1 Tax=Haloarcula salina TaxID=1429914 RepID=A0AA41GAS6_9EURY|nr:glycosyltransferase family 2 protein [Haloarcula salina]MBV0903307.1 glycosyltransferase family 2 protein [Haloarcula salina]
MSGDPTVSVVVPTYNRPARLHRAIESISEQTYGNIEIIVVDDHSKEPASSIVDGISTAFDITVLRHSENRGANAARNSGIERATGEYISFLDDDDTWEPDKITKQVQKIESESIGLVYTGMKHINDDGEVTQESRPQQTVSSPAQILKSNTIGSFSVVLVDREVISQVGLPDEKLPIWQDKEWYIRIARQYDLAPVKESLVNHHHGSGDRVSGNFDGLVETTLPHILTEFRDEIDSQSLVERQRTYSEIYYSISRYGLATGHFSAAKRYSRLALIRFPFNYKALAAFVFSLRKGYLYSSYKSIAD